MGWRRVEPTRVWWPLGGVVMLCLSATLAEAGPTRHTGGHVPPALVQLERASTDCFAEAVLANPTALARAKAGEWYRAAGVIGTICRRDVDVMMQARDALHGPGAGERFFRSVYVKRLDRELAARLQPWLERQAMASAGPTTEQAATAATE